MGMQAMLTVFPPRAGELKTWVKSLLGNLRGLLFDELSLVVRSM